MAVILEIFLTATQRLADCFVAATRRAAVRSPVAGHQSEAGDRAAIRPSEARYLHHLGNLCIA